ncbi:MAG TPA: low affinity iron permease family protein [Actinomycetota bacterium]
MSETARRSNDGATGSAGASKGSGRLHGGSGHAHVFFTSFSDWVAKWTGSHWAISAAAIFVVVALVTLGIEITNILISIVTLLMVFVLQNTQNRDSAALHVKLDEMVRVQPDARDEVRGIESKSEQELHELHPDNEEPATPD